MVQERISVVIPVFNEEKGLEELFRQLVPVMDSMNRDYEVVLVDDGSTDGSLEILRRHANARIRIVELTRNYGQHAAIFAGFETSKGGIIITMDADLQNPPSEIPRLVRTMEEGDYEVGHHQDGRAGHDIQEDCKQRCQCHDQKDNGSEIARLGVHAEGLPQGCGGVHGGKPRAFNLYPCTGNILRQAHSSRSR
jgi:glycosyltransferase involved in cell wall biosynthesis